MNSQLILQKFIDSPFRQPILTSDEELTIDQDLDRIIDKIKRCKIWQEAEPSLIELGELQRILVTLRCRYEVPFKDRPRTLIREYDRADLSEIRKMIFEKIRDGSFP
jgi:hypothetical protein